MDLTQWQPKTKAGRLVKMGKISSWKELLESKLPIKEPEIAQRIFSGGITETTLKVMNIGSGEYRRKAVACVSAGDGYIGFGRRCAKTSQLAVEAASRNARLRVIQIQLVNGTVARDIEHEYAGTKVTILPSHDEIVGSPMAKFVLNFVGILKGKIITNSVKDNVCFLEALIGAIGNLK